MTSYKTACTQIANDVGRAKLTLIWHHGVQGYPWCKIKRKKDPLIFNTFFRVLGKKRTGLPIKEHKNGSHDCRLKNIFFSGEIFYMDIYDHDSLMKTLAKKRAF